MRFLAIAAFAASLVVGTAHAAVLVDRGLPTDNLNNAAGGDRSNVAWGFAGDYASGDTFTLSKQSRIDRLTTWLVTGSPDPQDNFELDSRFADVSLFVGPSGPAGTEIDKVATSAISGSTATASNVSVSKVTYDGGSDYQGSFGGYIQIWRVDFTGLGTFAPGEYLFSVNGTDVAGDIWFNHASNAALGGVPADGADDLYAWFSGAPGDATVAFGGPYNSKGTGWDKASDINVVIEGAVVPLPASGLMLLAGAGCLGALRRRRKAG